MKIHTFFSPSNERLFLDFFYKSFPFDEYDLVIKKVSYPGNYINYKSRDWEKITLEKLVYIKKIIQEKSNEEFIFSDPDCQFFRKSKRVLLKSIHNKDIVFQDNGDGMFCTGFFIAKRNQKTLKLFTIAEKILKEKKISTFDDQDAINDSIKAIANIKVGKLDKRFFNLGLSNNPSIWTKGKDFLIPSDMILHHGNWTIGEKNKILLLRLVRDKFQKQKTSRINILNNFLHYPF